MISKWAVVAGLVASLAGAGVAMAAGDDTGTKAMPPSGAPPAAAEHGSSMAGTSGSANEMKNHDERTGKQSKMANPHKTSE